jgi:hypothetical protein
MSPEVYADVKIIIAAEAAALGLPVQWPNIDFRTPPPPSLWLTIDLAAESSETIELGNRQWEERGSIWLHVMISLNSGIELALAYRKSLANAFRVAVPTTIGLYYGAHTYDPLSPDDGVWRRLSVAVSYRYYDTNTPEVRANAAFAGGADVGADAA